MPYKNKADKAAQMRRYRKKNKPVPIVMVGIVEVNAYCPKCGHRMRISLSEQEVKTE